MSILLCFVLCSFVPTVTCICKPSWQRHFARICTYYQISQPCAGHCCCNWQQIHTSRISVLSAPSRLRTHCIFGRTMHRSMERINGYGEANGSHLSDDSDQEEQSSINAVRRNGNMSSDALPAANEATDLCALCGKETASKCERCGDFYCSTQCQRQDWPRHRYICFPMPRLIRAGHDNAARETHPAVKTDSSKSSASVKDEMREGYKARQTSYVPTATPLPKAGSDVVITGFKSSNRCGIRQADAKTTEEYTKILKKIDNFGRYANDLSGVPKVNSYAIAQRNERWCRVQILCARTDNRIRVYFIDYGIVSIRYLRELRRISGTMSSLPSYVHMMSLHGVSPFTSQSKVLQELSLFCDKVFRLEFVEQDGLQGNVQLYDKDTNALFNEEILKISQECKTNIESKPRSNSSTISNDNDDDNGMDKSPESVYSPKSNETKDTASSSPTKAESIVSEGSRKKNLNAGPKQIQRHLFVPPFEVQNFDVNAKNVNMIIVDNSNVAQGYLGCILEENFEKLQAVQKFLQSYEGIGQPYKPKLDEYCIAHFEEEWYRAKVLEVLEEDKFLVAYIDFTNECELSSASIRRYPMTLTIPCCTHLCAIDELPEDLDEKLVNYLQKELSNFKKITINKVSLLDTVMMIEVKDLQRRLKEAKLL